MSLRAKIVEHAGVISRSRVKQAEEACTRARELEEAGNYERACKALSEFWPEVGVRPSLEGLDELTAGRVLLRAGALSGWMGSASQSSGAQETAKDLISESIEIFESAGERSMVAEGQTELAYCYWREGAYDEARITLREALKKVENTGSKVEAVALLRSAVVESSSNRLNDALHILTQSASLFDRSDSDTLKGRFHNELATILKNLSSAEKRRDYVDRALMEYTAASIYFEQAGHARYCAAVENNLGDLFFRVGNFSEAHAHLERARNLFASLKDNVHVAQVDETRARGFMLEDRLEDAEKTARGAVSLLEKGSSQALLAESLTTLGLIQARIGDYEQARASLERAFDVAERAGDREGAGAAALTLVEELNGRITYEEARTFYEQAVDLLGRTQHIETFERLLVCSRRLLTAPQEEATPAKEPHVDFIYAAESTAALLEHARQLAMTDQPVLIVGEPGTGKEVLARLVHEWSGRTGRFVTVDCGALSTPVAESQLFGHVKGSFEAARSDFAGAVRQADGGTLLLNNIADLSLTVQAKLLRLIEKGELYPFGAAMPERVNVRIVAVSNADLEEETARGTFRKELLYRLPLNITVPPLRERTEDIVALAKHYVDEAYRRHGKRVDFAPATFEAMRRLPLRGNARELHAFIENAVGSAQDGAEIAPDAVEVVAIRHVQKPDLAEPWSNCSLEDEVLHYEANLIRLALKEADGSVTRAARLLGVSYQGLAFILNTRQKELQSERTPVRPRRRSIINVKDDKAKTRKARTTRKSVE